MTLRIGGNHRRGNGLCHRAPGHCCRRFQNGRAIEIRRKIACDVAAHRAGIPSADIRRILDSRRPSIARQAYWTRLNRFACPHTATFAHGRTMVAGLRGSAGLAGYCRYVPGVREICIDRVSNLIRIPAWSLRLGALDSPLEERRFEPSVPLAGKTLLAHHLSGDPWLCSSPSLIWQKTSLICRYNSLIRPN